MVISWAITEVIRYTFYVTSLLGWEFSPLLWVRYSAFYVLYPTGASSEALLNLATLPVSVASGGSWFSITPLAHWDTYALVRGVLFVIWWPGESPAILSFFISFLGVSVLTGGGVLRRVVSDVYAHDQAAP